MKDVTMFELVKYIIRPAGEKSEKDSVMEYIIHALKLSVRDLSQHRTSVDRIIANNAIALFLSKYTVTEQKRQTNAFIHKQLQLLSIDDVVKKEIYSLCEGYLDPEVPGDFYFWLLSSRTNPRTALAIIRDEVKNTSLQRLDDLLREFGFSYSWKDLVSSPPPDLVAPFYFLDLLQKSTIVKTHSFFIEDPSFINSFLGLHSIENFHYTESHILLVKFLCKHGFPEIHNDHFPLEQAVDNLLKARQSIQYGGLKDVSWFIAGKAVINFIEIHNISLGESVNVLRDAVQAAKELLSKRTPALFSEYV